MKVLALEGSPHRGNTHERVERFGRALGALGDVEFEHVALRDLHIEPCRGCFLCFEKGEDACPLRDDKAILDRKLDEADAVVFATPVYAMHVTYLLKRFVDRHAHTFHRPRYFGKYAVGMAVTGGVGLEEALKYVRMFAGAWGFEYLGDLRYIAPPVNSSLVALVSAKDRTEQMARLLQATLKARPPRRLSTSDHLHFHVMRAISRRLEDMSPVDYAYWKEKGWLEPGVRYFTAHARAGILKSLYPRLVAWIVGRSVDRRLARLRSEGAAGETA